MKRSFCCFLVFIAIVTGMAQTASALNPYDDFSGTWINPGKWNKQEFLREIRSGKLFSRITAYNTSDFNYLYVSNALTPNNIYYLQADVTLTEAEATYDPNDPNISTSSHASVAGVFYNDGTGSAGSSVGDVMAQVRLAYSQGQLKAEYYVIRYTNQSGSTWTILHNDQINIPILLNQTYTLSVRFQPALRRFTFGVTGATPVNWTAPGSGIPPAPNQGWKALRTAVQAPVGYGGHVSATFDNALGRDINNAVILLTDDFAGPNIDNTKWMPNLEQIREIRNGVLDLKTKRINLTANTGTILLFQNPGLISEIQATVSLTEFQKSVANTNLQARLGGFFFNAVGNPSSNYQDEIFAAIFLGGTQAAPRLGWYVNRMTNADGTTNNQLGSDILLDPIVLGNTYTLYLGWDGTRFTFKCVDCPGMPSAVFAPGTPIFPSNIQDKELQVRIFPTTSPNNSTVAATFDNVWINAMRLYLPEVIK